MWQQKLSSRKLWAAIAGFVVAVMSLFGFEELAIKVAAVISAAGVIIAYIFGQGYI